MCFFLYPFSFNFSRRASHHVLSGCEPQTTACLQCPLRLLCLRILVVASSTPAPLLNTPASPPSQPVSLPDNNSLAQAISRPLAELLPSLLSSLQNSSGGSTNMAATSGPLSSASNSMQSQASLSSNTPCSTSSLQVCLLCPRLFQPTAPLGVLSCVYSPCHVLRQLACSGWEALVVE